MFSNNRTILKRLSAYTSVAVLAGSLTACAEIQRIQQTQYQQNSTVPESNYSQTVEEQMCSNMPDMDVKDFSWTKIKGNYTLLDGKTKY